MIYLKRIKYILPLLAIFFTGCASRYDYTIHKPKVIYKPSLAALDKLNRRNLGKRYVWAEEGPYCFDCSGLTYFTYGSMGIEIPRVSREQFKYGTPVSRYELRKGDLVFFDTKRHFTGEVNHVGIYIGNGKFIQAANERRGVIVSSLNNPYYQRRFLGARRVYNFIEYQQFQPQVANYQNNSNRDFSYIVDGVF